MTGGALTEVGFGLGSNIGDKAGHIRKAADLLGAEGWVEGLVLSSLYRTAPWGKLDQDWFVNACAVGHTRLPPPDLLDRVKRLEGRIGRVATVRWGPRVIDIDILYYGDTVLDSPRLTLPHRDLAIRPFVVVPLAELRPDRVIAGRSLALRAADFATADVVRLEGTGPAASS